MFVPSGPFLVSRTGDEGPTYGRVEVTNWVLIGGKGVSSFRQ